MYGFVFLEEESLLLLLSLPLLPLLPLVLGEGLLRGMSSLREVYGREYTCV